MGGVDVATIAASPLPIPFPHTPTGGMEARPAGELNREISYSTLLAY